MLELITPAHHFQSTSINAPQPHRRPLTCTRGNNVAWRNRFKQQCRERIQRSRQEAFDKRRGMSEESWIHKLVVQEWQQFQQAHERSFLLEVGEPQLIEEDLLDEICRESNTEYDPMLDEILAQEEAELASAIEAYQYGQDLDIEMV
ncbi:uncharacterized protein VTP21DRAFT_7987 [Calcarisporiella thermophila]|uniref:uncharacterized protein n=1 Tax=Calcarisporiella thermophila TaxID=911321 RepID=UPI003743C03E